MKPLNLTVVQNITEMINEQLLFDDLLKNL
ncbi:hypothetical protein GASC598I20_013590 [Gilliamella apicola SCGC AB-598-I20]|nr:hypothetical protein GASC598I20_013590 [Gilliamella apicola SCGC AB-598-I20]